MNAQPGPRTPTKVLFLIGKGRSGSTLLDNVLGGVDGFTSVGELNYLWDWGLRRNYRCGCARTFDACPRWAEILEETFGGERPDPEELERDQANVFGWRHAPRLLGPGGPRPPRRLATWATTMSRLYASIASATDAAVVVDSSKQPANPAALGLVEGVEPHVVQLVRDPRAVAYSWQRRKAWTDRTDEAEMPTFGPIHTALSWSVRQLASERARNLVGPDRSLLLRYEDFVAEPRAAVERLVALAGEPGRVLPFVDERTAELTENHTVGGNPDRVGRRSVVIDEDRRWQDEAGGTGRRVVTAATAPLRRRYGYGRRRAR